MYWGVGMALLIGGLWVAGILFFATADLHRASVDHSTIAIGALALTILAALCYSPFLNWWFDSGFEVKWLREALYARRLEDLADYMAVCQMGGRTRIAAALVKIWTKHGFEPGWSARPMDPPPQFR